MKTLFFLLFSLQAFSETTILELGQSKIFPLSAKQIWIEKSSILKASSVKGSLRITAKKIGSSRVRINSTNQTIEVLHPDQIMLYENLKKMMNKKPGLRAEIENGEVVIKGYLHDWSVWKSIANEVNFSSYSMGAELSDPLKASLQKTIDSDLREQGLLSVNVVQSPRLEVRLNPQQPSLDRYRDYFQKLGIGVVVAADSLEILPVIRVDITVVEMSQKSSREMGIQWPTKADFQVLPNKLVTSDSLIATLNALESQGEAKMLASPNLICRSGEEAEFLAGGEIPIKFSNKRSQEVVWRKFGVLLKIKPVADSSGRISLSIETEVSSLSSTLYGEVPGIDTNRVSSHFDLSHSQVVALSGLLKESENDTSEGLAYLSQIPILGQFFSNRKKSKEKKELVIFVRPRLMDQEPVGEWIRGASHANTSL